MDAENISKSYVSRILRLAMLAPNIVDGILAGSTDQVLMLERLERLERPLPASWEEQRSTEADTANLMQWVKYLRACPSNGPPRLRNLRQARAD